MRLSLWLVTGTLVLGTPCTSRAQAPQRRAPGPTPCAGAASTDTAVFAQDQVTEGPALRTYPQFDVPSDLVGSALHLAASFIVNADGAVDTASIVIVDSSRTVMDQRFVAAVKTFAFWPACRNGHPVRVRVRYPFDLRPPS